tara:strand:+ start:5196 stop:6125 length:930 start_codon:yes stop_codon:yes gene_type:complete
MHKRILLIITILFSIFYSNLLKANIYIVAKVDGQIITNYDISKESDYLKILNPNLDNMEVNQLLQIAKNSLIKEIIKKKHIANFMDIKQENPYVDSHLKSLYEKLDLNDEKELENKLIEFNNYTLEQIKTKIKVELFWNELIFIRYKDQLKIDQEILKRKIDQIKEDTQKEYFLAEILFKKEKQQPLENLINQIKLSLNEIGFDNTATIYSISESANFGGKLGWINENGLSSEVSKKLNLLNEGDITDPIKINNNYLILKIVKIRLNQIKIDKEKELQKLIQIETNKQLNRFSRIYFDKTKKNFVINEK